MAGIEELRRQRNEVLVAVYQLTDGDRLEAVKTGDVSVETAIEEEQVGPAVRWLVDRDLLEFHSLAGDFNITAAGVDEAERLLDEAAEAGDTLTVLERRVLEAFTRDVRTALDNTSTLEPEAMADAHAQLATIEAQQRSPNPRREIVRPALRALQLAAGAVVAGVLGNAAYAAVVALMT